jgi:hypothetical protein
MSRILPLLTATACCVFMREHKFAPASIINCGIGKRSPEIHVWKWLLPEAQLLGIDPRWSPRGTWQMEFKAPQVVKALGDGTKATMEYCGACRGKCLSPENHTHRVTVVPMGTLDEIVAEHQLPPPYFLWMDIDGSEPEALRGGTETLKHTGWVNVEFNAVYGEEHAMQIHLRLAEAGFRLSHVHLGSHDRLYRRFRALGT